jgi:16S rRNA (uracil1498-N3)-methyltransferase
MRRFFIEKLNDHLEEGGLLCVPDDIMHRIRNVLRFKDGDLIEFIDGKGLLLTAKFIQNSAIFQIISKQEKLSTRPLLAVAVSLIRRERFDLLVEKSVELGADLIIPIETERSRPFEPDSYPKLCQRWQRIADQALSQCKRIFRTKIHDVIKISDLGKLKDFSQKIYFDFDKTSFKEHEFINDGSNKIPSCIFIIGPEGGFTVSEKNIMDGIGIGSYSITEDILRTETAAFYALSVFRYRTT